ALQKLDNFVNDGLDLFIKLSDQIADSKTELASLTDNVDGLIRQLAGLASQVLPFDSFKSAIAAVNEELEKARVDIALLQDAGELTGNLLAGVVKALALVIEKSIQQALGVVGISIRALDEDILRLTKDLAEINVRLEQGAINAARVTNEILAAKAGAGFVSSPARGDFRTDLNRRDFGAELRGPASATPASGNTLLTTNKPRGGTGGGGGRRSREVSELEQLSKQIKDAEKDLKSLLDTGSKEFQLKIKLDDVKALNSSLDDLRKLQRETGLFSDVKGLQRLDAKGSVNVGETQKAVSGEIARQKAFQETLKFSRTKIAIPREAIDALDFTRPIVQQFTELNKIIEETNPEAAEFVLNAFLLSDRFKLLREQGGPLVEGLKELAKQLQGMAELDAQQVALKGFEERISSLKESLRGLTETERLFEEIKRSKLSPEDQRRLLGQLGEVQQIEEFKRQEERAQQTAQRVGDFFTEAFRDSFQRGPKAFWDRTEQAAKETLARIGADIFKNLVLRFLNLPTGGGGGFGIGGGQQSSGGNFLGNIFNGILNPGGGSFGNILGPGGTPPFLPSSSSAGGSSGSGFKGILNNLLGFNLFKSAGTAAGVPLGTSGFSTTSGSLTSLHELGHAGAASAAAPSALAGLGATGLLAGGGILGSLLGGDSKAGKLLGFGGGTALAGFAGASGLFGGGIAGALPALFSNPFTAIIGGALLGGALLFNLFGNRDLKKLRKTISSEYAVDVKDKNVLKQIKEIGKGVFGKTWEDRMRDVVRLEASKEIIAAYAEGTRQNAKGLVLEKELLDPNNKRNQFIRQIEPVKRISGGIIPGVTRGFDHIVALMDGGEGVLTSRTTARIGGAGAVDALNAGRADVVPRNIQQAQPGIIGMPAGLLQALINAIAQFQSIPPGHLLINAMNENPGAVANANDEGMKRSGSLMAISVQRLAGGYQ
ncbi:MAG TPA: hypothetical protein VEF04_13345, partial [Blastocatellia bacterium]|nr:hypothetical protein [Blastocatellia bacterium]